MKDQSKTKQSLIQELASLREKITELEKSESARKRAEETLRESEEKLHLIVNTIPHIVSILDMNLHCTYLSPSCQRLLGYTQDEALALNLNQLITPESLEIAKKSYQEDLELEHAPDFTGHRVRVLELNVYHKNGSVIPFENTITFLRDTDGVPIGIVILSTDISERKRSEEDLRKSENQLRTIIEGTQASLVRVDVDGRFSYANDAMAKALGYRIAAEIIGRPYLHFIHPDDRQRVMNTYLHQVEALQPSSTQEFRIVNTEGRIMWLSFLSSIVFKDGQVVGQTGVAQNITERKQTEEALRESEEKYKFLVENTNDIIWVFDLKTMSYSFCSNSVERILGYTADETVGMKLDDIFSKESQETLLAAFGRIVAGKEPSDRVLIEVEHIAKNGSRLWMEINAVLKRDKLGNPVAFNGVTRDITERKRAEAALRQSEEKYRLLTENSNDVIWTTDTELRFTYYSPAVRKLRGLEPEEAVKKTLVETVTPASLNSIISTYKHFLPDIEQGLNPTAVMEVEQYRKDGSTVWVEISVTTMRDERGNLTGLVGATRDISARKLAEDELQLRNILLSTQQEVSIDGILVVDENGTIISFNRRFVEIWAIPNDVVESKSDERALQSVMGNLVDPDEFIAKVRHLYENRSETSRDEIALKDGRILDRYSAPMLGDDGRYYGRIWYFRDITKRKRSEQALYESERRLSDIINFLPIATMVIDREGKITAWNRAMEAITGVKREDMIGKGDYEYALPFYKERRPILIDRVFATDKEIETLYNNIHLEKGILSAEAYIPNLGIILVGYASKLHDSAGNVVGAIESIYNITDIRQVEAELKEAKKAADAANQSKSIFLANMSHEIRTPMNAILGFAQLIERDPQLSPQSREHLEIINRSGEHLMALINDILEMSKIEAGRATFVQNTFDLHALLRDIERMFHVRTDAKNLRFLLEMVGHVPQWVFTDEGKLRQVLINLLGNSVKFTKEGGIALRLSAKAGKADMVDLQFEVEDTGPGMAEEEIGHLFQAFEQTRTGNQIGGTGLGLSLSRGFVQIMGGSISVASTIGKGTTFRFEIPVRESTEEQTPSKEAKRRVLRLSPGQGNIRVLIADDRETNRQLLSRLLGVAGFQTLEVVNGEEAVHMVHEWKPRVVLMDMTMPVMDGYEATRKIKESPDIKDTAIIAVTASAFEEDKKRVFAAGADAYLSKPFKDADLFENIGQLTGAEYLYEETDGAKAAETMDDKVHMRKTVASLPPDFVNRMRKAVESADLDLLNEFAEQLVTDHPTLAKWMQEMAARYEYEALIDIFSNGV